MHCVEHILDSTINRPVWSPIYHSMPPIDSQSHHQIILMHIQVIYREGEDPPRKYLVYVIITLLTKS